jgi:hypothetical protein
VQVQRARFFELVAAIAASTACATPKGDAPAVVVPVDTTPLPPPPPPAPIASGAVVPMETPVAKATHGIWDLPYDDKATPKSCAQIKCPGPTQEAFPVLKSNCKSLEQALRPEVFQRFMTCMLAHNNTPDVCDLSLVGIEPGQCLEKWSEPPQLDPASEAKCKPLVKRCAGQTRSVHADAPITLEACRGLMSITTARHEPKMIHCIVEYCDGAPGLCYIPY